MNTASHSVGSRTIQSEIAGSRLGHFPATPCDDEIDQMSSAEQGREGCDPGNPRSSRAFRSDCTDLVHELANTTTAVLVGAQVLGWRLPPYSRLKRPLREIERNAQRGGELMKRLLSRLSAETIAQTGGDDAMRADARPPERPAAENVDRTRQQTGPGPGNELSDAVTAQEPGVDSGSKVNLPPRMNTRPAPVFSPAPNRELTSGCDACTSTFPKKG